MPPKNHPGLAERAGEACAQVQHITDLLFKWGFSRLRVLGKEQHQCPPRESKILCRLKKIGRTSVKLLGDFGTSYLEKYEDLKARSRS
ncbi:MAG: hypothetical protein PHI23_03825 [Candidatus Peribacteraceae bacterium]|nr:hypothetical protein [Candidatus Peribacteraceae bacterium]